MEICFYDDDDDAWVVQYNEFYLFYFGEFEWGGGYGFGYTISLVTVNTRKNGLFEVFTPKYESVVLFLSF